MDFRAQRRRWLRFLQQVGAAVLWVSRRHPGRADRGHLEVHGEHREAKHPLDT